MTCPNSGDGGVGLSYLGVCRVYCSLRLLGRAGNGRRTSRVIYYPCRDVGLGFAKSGTRKKSRSGGGGEAKRSGSTAKQRGRRTCSSSLTDQAYCFLVTANHLLLKRVQPQTTQHIVPLAHYSGALKLCSRHANSRLRLLDTTVLQLLSHLRQL